MRPSKGFYSLFVDKCERSTFSLQTSGQKSIKKLSRILCWKAYYFGWEHASATGVDTRRHTTRRDTSNGVSCDSMLSWKVTDAANTPSTASMIFLGCMDKYSLEIGTLNDSRLFTDPNFTSLTNDLSFGKINKLSFNCRPWTFLRQ